MKAALLALVLVALAVESRAGCGLRVGDGAIRPLADLPEGTIRGQGVCDGVETPMAVWTMAVDGGSEDLGIRDRPLLQSAPANPLIAVEAAAVGTARITVFRRRATPDPGRGPDDRRPFRFFGTLCDAGAAEPLDCSAGSSRVRMRANVMDTDQDGVLDRVRHEVSIWDGADRLQVMMFETRHAGRPLSNAAAWIDALRVAGRL